MSFAAAKFKAVSQPNSLLSTIPSPNRSRIPLVVIIMALAAITIDSLSTNENYKTNDWKSTSKNVVKEAFNKGRIQKASSAESMLPISVNEYFDQLKDARLEDEKANPDQLLPFAMCKSNSNHILKLAYKINSKKGVIGSFTTSSLLQHPCYKKSIQSKNSITKPLTGTEINEARLLLKLGAAEFAYKDIKPFTIVSGEGAIAYTKSAIKVGVMLGRMPSDQDLHKLIARRGPVKREIVKIYKSYTIKKKSHLEQLDSQILPPFHMSQDMWTRDYTFSHFLGVLGHEANWETHGIDIFVLGFIEFEEMVEEIDEGEYLEDGSEESGYNSSGSDDESEDDGGDGESEDNEYVEADWDYSSEEDDAESEDEKHEEGDVIGIKTKTSVTGAVIASSLKVLQLKNGLKQISESEDTFVAMDSGCK
eukprot:497897_1